MRLLAALAAGIAVTSAVAAVRGITFPAPARPRWWRTPRWLLSLERQRVSTVRFVAGSATGAVAALVLCAILTRSLLVAIVPAVVVGGLPAAYYQRASAREEQRRLEAWPDALRSLVGSLSAGSSLHDGCAQLARSGPPPLRLIFGRYTDLAKIMTTAAAFDRLRAELAHPVSDQIFEVLTAAAEDGATNTVQVLGDLAASTTATLQLNERIETQRVQHKLNAWAVFLVPWLTLIFLTARPGAFRDYYASSAAVPVLLAAAAMSLGGMVIVLRLSRLPTQPRVLAGGPAAPGGRETVS